MKHSLKIEGALYKLRPVELNDADFIVAVRLEDAARSKYIHAISNDVNKQREWLEEYFKREDDYYFVVENRITGESEGLISIYNVNNLEAEWGRWVLKKSSFAAIESACLVYRVAFELLKLKKLYCRTIELNKSVVSFHDSIGEIRNDSLNFEVEWGSERTRYIEHYSDSNHFYSSILPNAEIKVEKIQKRFKKQNGLEMIFDHIGVASKKIEKEIDMYKLLGYRIDSEYFEDRNQGIRGVFISHDNSPRLELIENLPGRDTITIQINKGQKMYHTAYYVDNFDGSILYLKKNGARVISEPKQSVYFGKRICFLVLRNMDIIELLER